MEYINFIVTLIIVFIIFAFVYFPKKKQDELLKKMQDELKVGDKIITYSGLSGEIIEILQEERVIIKMNPSDTLLSIEKWAIAGLDERNK